MSRLALLCLSATLVATSPGVAQVAIDPIGKITPNGRFDGGSKVQLGRDEDKPFSWPFYAAAMRLRYRCDTCLLVYAVEVVLVFPPA